MVLIICPICKTIKDVKNKGFYCCHHYWDTDKNKSELEGKKARHFKKMEQKPILEQKVEAQIPPKNPNFSEPTREPILEIEENHAIMGVSNG